MSNQISKTRLKAVILAAGKGKRMQADGEYLPKVLRPARGLPLLHYVLSSLEFIPPEDVVIVVGYKKEMVMEAFPGFAFAEQTDQLGTGHAVMAAADSLEGYGGSILVCCGDMPLISRGTYEKLARAHEASEAACTVLSGTSDVPLPYGRVVRGADGSFDKIVEEKDCTGAQLEIAELNSGVYVFEALSLFPALSLLGRDNAQGEYYLTDVPELMKKQGLKIEILRLNLGCEIIGVNTPEQLLEVERLLPDAKQEKVLD